MQVMAYLTALWVGLGVALAILAAVTLGFSPALWLFFTRNIPDRFGFVFLRWDLFCGILIAWTTTIVGSVRAIKAIRAAATFSGLIWADQITPTRHPAVAELVGFLRSTGVKLPGGNVGVALAFPAGVDWKKVGKGRVRAGMLLLGLHAIAVLSQDELRALAVKHAFRWLDPPSPMHPWLIRLHINVERWRSIVPPDDGFPSLVHKLLEWLDAILKPVAPQGERWSVARTCEIFPAETLRTADRKMLLAAAGLKDYMDLFIKALDSDAVPPFTEGLHQLLKNKMKPHFDTGEPFYRQIDGLWVYEQRFGRAFKGQQASPELRMASWDDLQMKIATQSWTAIAAAWRPHLIGRHVNDFPELIRDWRPLTRRFIRWRAVARTPDVLRQMLINSLASVFAIVLLEAGWENHSRFGEESTFQKDGQELKPFELLNAVGTGRLPAEEFSACCRDVAQLKLW